MAESRQPNNVDVHRKHCNEDGCRGQSDDDGQSIPPVRKLDYSKEPSFFLCLSDDWDLEKFPILWTIGNADLLKCELVALFCSRKCPGTIIRKAHDFVAGLYDKEIPVIGGFQTEVEKMSLDVLMQGKGSIVVCPAREISTMRPSKEWIEMLKDGRLLIVSPFASRFRRPTRTTADIRNHLVAAAAEKIIFLHAEDGSRTFAIAQELLLSEREIHTFDLKENRNLLDLGATCL
ncbi:MAG: DNA-processing protein DprA [Bacteroidetes bacterium]|nr:DNA-processing protein DprA [Bacteroidota bacterium]